MTYKLKFLPSALKEWEKLDRSIKDQFRKKLHERLENPHIPSAQLHGFKNHYKIKLLSSGYRLVYEVIDNELYILVIVVGKREKGAVYNIMKKRRP
ncbi:MAG: type II toxin-antitoxin system RelE/ParE family toxin [Desulfatiglans sp.]|jgi:mRNA interferase RelE/StbE|nr:type II toxin-antitoxin system RelE/ParE family toxin [Desulfatiglans sp.]